MEEYSMANIEIVAERLPDQTFNFVTRVGLDDMVSDTPKLMSVLIESLENLVKDLKEKYPQNQ